MEADDRTRARMVVDRSAIKHRFAERTTTILLAR
jgi:hypothetical protein